MGKEMPDWLTETNKAKKNKAQLQETAILQNISALHVEEAEFQRKVQGIEMDIKESFGVWEKFGLDKILEDLVVYLGADKLGKFTLTFRVSSDPKRTEKVQIKTNTPDKGVVSNLIQNLKDLQYTPGTEYSSDFKGVVFESVEREVQKDEQEYWNNGDSDGWSTETRTLFAFEINSQGITFYEQPERNKTLPIGELGDVSDVKKAVDNFLAEGVGSNT